jgi:hypothetical protein
MIRFIWLILSLTGWGTILYMMPRLPPVVFLITAGISAVGYLYGWVMHKRNWFIHFFTSCLWTGVWIACKGMAAYAEHADRLPLSIPPATIGKTLMILGMVVSMFLTFANYRIALNFVQRRGNIDRDMLGRLHGDQNPWERFIRRLKRKKGLLIQLGEEVPFD